MILNKTAIEKTAHAAYNAMNSQVGLCKPIPQNPNRYGDVKGIKFEDPVIFVAHPTLNPSELRLSELGWQKDDVEIVVRAPHIELRRVGLANEDGSLNFDTEWRIDFKGRRFEICKLHSKEPFLSNVPVYVWIGGRNPNGRSS